MQPRTSPRPILPVPLRTPTGGNTTGGFFDGTIDLAVPFTVEADGEYTAELYTTGLANLTVVEASFSAAIPDEEIKAVEDKIAAIGDVKYDPDKSEDSGELITAARDAYNALAEKYGDVSSMVDNFEVLTSAENVYANLKEEYDTMIENAATVDKAINAIESPSPRTARTLSSPPKRPATASSSTSVRKRPTFTSRVLQRLQKPVKISTSFPT